MMKPGRIAEQSWMKSGDFVLLFTLGVPAL